MKEMKRIVAVLLISSILSVNKGCGFKSSSEKPLQSSAPSSLQEPYFNLEVWDYRVYVGDSRLTIVQAFGLNEPIIYKSSNPDIVAMGDKPYNATTIYAKKAGEVTIKVKYGYFEDTIRVISTFGDLKPELKFIGDIRNENRLIENEELDLSLYILFNQKEFEPTSVIYEIWKDNQAVTDDSATVTDGKFVGRSGEYKVGITATWSNYEGDELRKIISIRVSG